MQLPTHILAGVAIQKACSPVKSPALARTLTALLAFLSHGILDKLANLTYHPPNPDFHSVFWVGYHASLVVLTVMMLLSWWRTFRWGITFAILPDFDWVLIHGQEIFHFRLPFYQQPHLHHLLHFLYQKTPVALLDRLPNFRHDPRACLWELLPLMALLLVSRFRSKKIHSQPQSACA